MGARKRCRIVRKFILTVPEGDLEGSQRAVYEHLAECQRCRRLLAVSRRLERSLSAERLRLMEMVGLSREPKSRLTMRIGGLAPARRGRRFRAAWAGAAGLALAMAGVSAAYLLRGRDGESPRGCGSAALIVTRATAAASSSATLQHLAEVMQRKQAPFTELPYKPPAYPREPLLPPFLEQCALESEETLRTMIESKTKLIRREET